MSDTDETLTSEAEAAELRSKVLAIQRNSELSAAEKSRAIQVRSERGSIGMEGGGSD